MFIELPMKNYIAIIFLCFLVKLNYSQHAAVVKPQSKGSPVAADFAGAIQLNLVRSATYGPTIAPKGFGKKKEIQACDKFDIYRFEKEHNSAWYYFVAPKDGEIIFDVIPVRPQDDYDFMLFKYTDTSFCSEIMRENLLPVKMNMARVGKDTTGIIGLSNSGEKDTVLAGPGNSYCSPLQVKKGEKYYLVLDNVYSKGMGHIIQMYYQKEVNINGTVEEDNKKPAVASVSIKDKTGKGFGTTSSDSFGKFSLSSKIHEGESYSLIFNNDKSFFSSREINTAFLAKTNYELNDVKAVLNELVNEKKYVLSSIDFVGNTSKIMQSSMPSVITLADFLKGNDKVKIKIEGHVNNPANYANSGVDHTLSEARAKVIYDLLVKQGVPKNRMEYLGYGSLFMIYPKPSGVVESNANNRIEIFILLN